MQTRGFTLIELLVGTAIALIMTAAAVMFATQETRLLTRSRDKLEVAQVGRAALALMANDIRKAGSGVGYREDGTFLGLDVGQFTVGGLAFNPVGTPTNESNQDTGVYAQNNLRGPNTVYADVRTQDLLVQFADGEYTTVTADLGRSGNTIQGLACRQLPEGTVAVLRDQTGITSTFGTYATATHSGGTCKCNQESNPGSYECFPFDLANVAPLSGLSANSVRYGFGELQAGARSVVWFVASTAGNEGQLRRAELDLGDTGTCTTGRLDCGGVVAFDAEALYVRVWRFDEVTSTWIATGGQPILARDSRIRVDVELVVRGRGTFASHQPEVRSSIFPARCFPGGNACGGGGDRVPRAAHRTSIEIMNSGLM